MYSGNVVDESKLKIEGFFLDFTASHSQTSQHIAYFYWYCLSDLSLLPSQSCLLCKFTLLNSVPIFHSKPSSYRPEIGFEFTVIALTSPILFNLFRYSNQDFKTFNFHKDKIFRALWSFPSLEKLFTTNWFSIELL